MADTSIQVTQGSNTHIDTRTESSNGNHRQVIVIGDPSTNSGVAPVDATTGLKVNLGSDNSVVISGTVAVTDNSTTLSVDDGGSTLSIDDNNSSITIDDGLGSITVDDGGTSLTIDGTVTIEDGGNVISVDDGGGSLTVDGTVAVSGAVTVQDGGSTISIDDGSGSVTIDGSIKLIDSTGDSVMDDTNNAVRVNLVAGSVTISSADGAVTDGVDNTIKATVLDKSNSNPLTVAIVDGSGDQITSFGGTGGTSAADDADFTDGTTPGTPIMGVYESTPSTVTDGDLGVAGITQDRQLKVSVGNTVTVTATNLDVQSGGADLATATQGANISTKIDTLAGAVSGTEMQVDVLTMPTVAVTQSGTWDEIGINDSGNSITVDNGGTFAVQVDGSALTSLQLIDDAVYTDGSGTPSKGLAVMGTDGTNPQILKVSTNGELQVVVPNEVSASNSTTTPLAGDAVFTGTGVDVTNYSAITVFAIADQNSASGGLAIEFSSDNTNWDQSLVGNVTANIPKTSGQQCVSKYMRVKYTNGATPQGSFRLQTIFHVFPVASGLVDTAQDGTSTVTVGTESRAKMQNFNGTSWDRVRTVINATNSTGTGITAAGILAQFDDTSPQTVTENQFGNVRMSAKGVLYNTIRDAAGNERGLNIDANGEPGISAIRSALPAGTNNIGDVDVASIAAGDNNIGNVDVVTVPADPFGANADAASATGSVSAKLRYLAATGIAGMTTLPAGTNAIGKLAANSGIDIGDVDVTSLPKSIQGPGIPNIDSYSHAAINLAAGANQVLVSSAANKQVWVYGIGFTVNAAGTVSFQDEDDTAITGIMPFAASSGLGISPTGNFSMPIWKLATDKDLEVDIVTSELDGWIDYAIVSV